MDFDKGDVLVNLNTIKALSFDYVTSLLNDSQIESNAIIIAIKAQATLIDDIKAFTVKEGARQCGE